MCGETQGPDSEMWSFTAGSGGTMLPGPSLLSPASGSTLAGTTVTPQWSSVSGAAEYVVYDKADRTSWRTVNGTQITINWLDPHTTYEWWVKARNDYAWGAESIHWTFTTGASSFSAPWTLPMPQFQRRVVGGNGDKRMTFGEHRQ